MLGQKVRHPEYGVGTVVGVEGDEEDRRVSVSFPGRGTKKFIERYAQLDRSSTGDQRFCECSVFRRPRFDCHLQTQLSLQRKLRPISRYSVALSFPLSVSGQFFTLAGGCDRRA